MTDDGAAQIDADAEAAFGRVHDFLVARGVSDEEIPSSSPASRRWPTTPSCPGAAGW